MSLQPLAPLALFLSAAAPGAQLVTDTQIADVNANPAAVGSYSGGFASDGQLVYFRAIDKSSGEGSRLWRTDGTAAGTLQLDPQALSVLESVFAPGGDLFFLADELGIGVALWRSDGTPAGTQRVLAPQAWTTAPYDLTVYQGDVYFLAGLPATGVEVWKSEVATGTNSLAFELQAGPLSTTRELFAGGGTLFVATPTALLATDGTPGSAVSVTAVANAQVSNFELVAEVGARAVFSVSGFGAAAGWWSSDGTPAGTFQLLTTLNDFWLAQGDTKVFLTAGGLASTPQLFETDGTLAGTLPIDLPSTTGGQLVAPLEPGVAFGDELFYGGTVSTAGVELCRTTGAAAGAIPVADIRSGPGSSTPDDFALFGDSVFFRADDGINGREIWELDLVSGSVELVEDLFPGPFSGIVGSSPTLFTSQAGVVFGQNFADVGIEPARTDGQETGLLLNIGDDGASAGSNPREFARFGSRVLFQAFDESVGNELWSTDGTAAGTQLVADIDPVNSGFGDAFGSFPHHFVVFGDRAFFFATEASSGSELWSTDGSAAGTQLVADLVPGPGSSEPLFSAPPVVLGEALFFIARQPSGAFGLFKTDGTEAGTELVVTTDPSGFIAEFVTLLRVNDRLVFNANGPEGLELWSSDGTAAGTSVLADMTPGAGSTFFSEFAQGDTRLFIRATIHQNERTLWTTDGTPAGTQLFFSQPDNFLFGANNLTAFGDDAFFTMWGEATGRELWFTDGTTAGTELVLDVVPGPDSSAPANLVTAGDRLYFVAQAPDNFFHYQQLWSSDGTAAGTSLVADLPSPVAGSGIANLWSIGPDRRVLFSNVDGNGNEWWVSDGTPAGTEPLADSAAGPKFANPRPGVLVGNRLVFQAGNGLDGTEVHAIALAETAGFAATNLGTGCAGAGGTPQLAFGGGAIALGESFSVELDGALPASVGLWFFDFAYGGLPAVGACALQLPLPQLLTATVAGAAGATTLTLDVPSGPALVGAQVDFQVLSSEAGGPFLGIGALSDVLEVVVGP